MGDKKTPNPYLKKNTQFWPFSWNHCLPVIHQNDRNEGNEGKHLLCLLRVLSRSAVSLCDLLDRSPPGSSVHGISQQGYWSGLSSSPGDSSQSRDRTHISCTGRQILYHWATWETLGLQKTWNYSFGHIHVSLQESWYCRHQGNGHCSKRNAPQMSPQQIWKSLQCHPECCCHYNK